MRLVRLLSESSEIPRRFAVQGILGGGIDLEAPGSELIWYQVIDHFEVDGRIYALLGKGPHTFDGYAIGAFRTDEGIGGRSVNDFTRFDVYYSGLAEENGGRYWLEKVRKEVSTGLEQRVEMTLLINSKSVVLESDERQVIHLRAGTSWKILKRRTGPEYESLLVQRTGLNPKYATYENPKIHWGKVRFEVGIGNRVFPDWSEIWLGPRSTPYEFDQITGFIADGEAVDEVGPTWDRYEIIDKPLFESRGGLA